MNTNETDGRDAAPPQDALTTPLEAKMAHAILGLLDRAGVQTEINASFHERLALTEAALAVVAKSFEAVYERLQQLGPDPLRN